MLLKNNLNKWTPAGCPTRVKCMDCKHYEPDRLNKLTVCPWLPRGKCREWGGFTYGLWYGWLNVHKPSEYELEKVVYKLKNDYLVKKQLKLNL